MIPYEWLGADGKPAGDVHTYDGWVAVHFIGGDVCRYVTPATARLIAAALNAAADELDPPAKVEPVKIERWLTPADVEKHGTRWIWWSPQWEVGQEDCTAVIDVGVVYLRRNSYPDETRWTRFWFTRGDYFTPIGGAMADAKIELITRPLTESNVQAIRTFLDSLPPKEDVEPVRIDRWLTEEDVEKHGVRWMWHGWPFGHVDFTAKISRHCVVMSRGNDDYNAHAYMDGDYFTPIEGTK